MREKKLLDYLKKSFYTGALKTIIVTLSTLYFLPLTIKQVGIETYGLISITMIFSGLTNLVDLGVSKTVTLQLGQSQSKTKDNSIISNALGIYSSTLILVSVIIAGFGASKVSIFGSNSDLDPSLINYITSIGYLLLIIMLLNNFFIAILEAKLLVHYINIGFIISSVSLNLITYLFAISFESVYILLLAPVVSNLLISSFFIIIIIKKTNLKLTTPKVREMKEILSTSYKFLNINLATTLVIPANKYLLVYFTGNSSAIGIFDIALKIANIANSFLNSIAQPLFGVFSSMKNENDKVYKIASKVSLLLFCFYILGCSLYFFIGENITYFLDSENHYFLFWTSMTLLLGVCFSSVAEPFYRAMMGTAKLKTAFAMSCITIILNLIMLITLKVLFNYDDFKAITLSFSSAIFAKSATIIFYYIKAFK